MLNRTEQNRTYASVDLCKFFMAIVVVAIHVHPFEGYAESTWIDIYRLMCYCAVPFFFLCTGYFLAKGIDCAEAVSALEQTKSYLNKTLKLYIIWTIVYIPLALLLYFTNTTPWWKDFIFYLHGLVIMGEHYNSWILWYLLSAVYGLAYLYVCVKYKFSLNRIVLIGFSLYLVGVLITSFAQYHGELPNILHWLQRVLGYCVSGRIFTSFFFIPMGMLIYRHCWSKWQGVLLIVSALLLWLLGAKDGIVLKNIVIAISSVGLFLFVINVHLSAKPFYRQLRISSTVVYFIHLWVWTVVYGIVYQQKNYGMDMFLLTLGISLVISGGYICYRTVRNTG